MFKHDRTYAPQVDIVKRLEVKRGSAKDLPNLLRQKGFHNNYDGWRGVVSHFEKVRACPSRWVALTFFRPTQEEHKEFSKTADLAAYAVRGLQPASLFEVLATIPDSTGPFSHEPVFEEFG